MTLAYIAIGSNIDSPSIQADIALISLSKIPDSRILIVSDYYRTSPLGPSDQPDYLNAAVALETTLDAYSLLDNIQRIERQQGRERSKYNMMRWGPRTLDLDLMLFGNEIINTVRLIIPHYDIHNRSFMLWPLIEIAPQLRFPNGKTLKETLMSLDSTKPPIW